MWDSLCCVNTMDLPPNLEHKPAIQRSDCGFERRKTFAVEMNALARSSDIQRSFLSGAGGGTRTHTPSLATDFESASSTIPTHRQVTGNYYNTSAGASQEVFPADGMFAHVTPDFSSGRSDACSKVPARPPCSHSAPECRPARPDASAQSSRWRGCRFQSAGRRPSAHARQER